MIIGIDFDGTCVTHEYPKVGKDIGAVPVLKKLIEAGHQLILFTMRSDKSGISPITGEMENGGLQDAVHWFQNWNIPLFGVNVNPDQHEWTSSPKAWCHLFIDDTSLGIPLIYDLKKPYVDWDIVYEMLINREIL